MKTKYIHSGIKIDVDSIRHHATTADTHQGGAYLKKDGTDRTLCTAIDHHSEEVYIYAETNGDPVVLAEGSGADFARTVGDNGDPFSGLVRLADLHALLTAEGNHVASWLEERLEEIRAELGA
jgi:hypothetical protein